MEYSSYRAIIERDHPGLEIVSMRSNLDGWDFFVFDINDAYIYRFPRRRDAVKNLRKEALLLPPLALHLKNYTAARIPEFERFVIDDVKPENSYVCYRKIHGEPWEDLDWEDAFVGDPALDFVGLFIWGGDEFVARVLDRYDVNCGSNFWSRLQFYTLATSFHIIEFGLDMEDERVIADGKNRLRGYVRNYG